MKNGNHFETHHGSLRDCNKNCLFRIAENHGRKTQNTQNPSLQHSGNCVLRSLRDTLYIL